MVMNCSLLRCKYNKKNDLFFSSSEKPIHRNYPYLCKNGNNRLSKLKIKNEKKPWSRQAAYPKYTFGEGKLLNKINKSEIEKWAGAVNK